MVSLICSMILATSVVTVDTGAAKCPTSPDLWGLFFEDIDLSLDGGVYAELVRNRSFEDFEGRSGELTNTTRRRSSSSSDDSQHEERALVGVISAVSFR